jgi:hypothetical protein
MNIADNILLLWLATIWIVFSIWIVAVAPFPLNLGFVAFQVLIWIVLVWTIEPVFLRSEVPSE